jgi:uncharacterized membrane protein
MQPTTAPTSRINSIDILRGLIMIIMALDHVRDFYSNVQFDPLDLTQTYIPLFFTRWITHYCAPIFVFLSGTSAFLSFSKGKTKKRAAFFLLTRGLWLIFIELAVVDFLWSFDITYQMQAVQVIWAIGWSMVVLAGLVFLKPVYIATIGLAMIFGHNLLDGIHAESFGSFKWLWLILHEQGFYPYGNGRGLFVMYPLIPWVGVMATGFAFGFVFKKDAAYRKSFLLKVGFSAIALFISIRFINVYGNIKVWQEQDVWYKTILSFIDCTKYPPSLLYLLMTLGPGILLLAFFEKYNNRLTTIISVYGKVPFFYYIMHLIFIHGSSVLTAYLMGINQGTFFNPNTAWGFGLPIVYLAWICIVTALYFPCNWFMKVKQRRKDWWLSYL